MTSEVDAKQSEFTSSKTDEESLLESGPIFTPRVSQQRYDFVKQTVKDFKSKKVIDMGCGECQLIIRLKREMCIEQLAGVDVNRNFLEASQHYIQPLLYEFKHGRPAPLEATLFQGSIGEEDCRLVGWDLLACVEVIEHLEEDNLKKMPEVIFGYLRPTIVVVTTPNKDFNVLFPGMEEKFRHWDHKFEWTRQEFQEWGDEVCHKYGYKVRYTGVGQGPDGTEHLGTCTQIAVFERIEALPNEVLTNTKEQPMPYNVVKHAVFPYKPDNRTVEEKLLLEAEYYAHKLALDALKQQQEGVDLYEEVHSKVGVLKETINEIVDGQFDDADEDDIVNNSFENRLRTSSDEYAPVRIVEEFNEDTFEVPLSRLMGFSPIQKLCSSVDMLRSVIKTSEKLRLSDDESAVFYTLPDPDEVYPLLDDDDLGDDEQAGDGYSYRLVEITEEECWD